MNFVHRLVGRIGPASKTWPDTADWAWAMREALWLVPAILFCGWFGGFLHYGITDDLAGLAKLAAIAIIAPATGEELIFRAAILPRPSEGRSPFIPIVVSIGAFVLWHPFQTLIYGADAVPLFLSPWFLLAVAFLGLTLARIYLATASLWPCILVHWLVVVGWKVFFGGPPNPFS